jgi:hypothetical protein
MKSIKNYPKTDSGDIEHVKYPVQITEDIIKRHQKNVIAPLVVGKWICVNVELPSGFSIPPTVAVLDTLELAKKGCKVHNSWVGYTERQVLSIIDKSMRASAAI